MRVRSAPHLARYVGRATSHDEDQRRPIAREATSHCVRGERGPALRLPGIDAWEPVRAFGARSSAYRRGSPVSEGRRQLEPLRLDRPERTETKQTPTVPG